MTALEALVIVYAAFDNLVPNHGRASEGRTNGETDMIRTARRAYMAVPGGLVTKPDLVLQIVRSVRLPAVFEDQRDGGPATYTLTNDQSRVRIGSYTFYIKTLRQALRLIDDNEPEHNDGHSG